VEERKLYLLSALASLAKLEIEVIEKKVNIKFFYKRGLISTGTY
jgi:hypothetical protein